MVSYVTGQRMALRQERMGDEQLVTVGDRHAVPEGGRVAVCGSPVEQVTSEPFSASRAGLARAAPCGECVRRVQTDGT